jgi:hypothetical protein
MKNLALFIVLIAVNLIVSWAVSKMVLTDDVYYYALRETLSEERVKELIESHTEFAWMRYVFLPIFLTLRVFAIAACIYTGFFLLNVEVQFTRMFQIALVCDFAFLIIPISRLIWFTFVDPNYTMEDVFNFPPDSLSHLFQFAEEDRWLKYMLSYVNAVQGLYILLTAKMLSVEVGLSFDKSVRLVFITYGCGLMIWILVTTFLILSLS